MRERRRTAPGNGAARGTTGAGGCGFSLFVDILARDAIQSLSRRRGHSAASRVDQDNPAFAEGLSSPSSPARCAAKKTAVVDTQVSRSTPIKRDPPRLQQSRLFDLLRLPSPL